MTNIGAISYISCAIAFFILSVILVISWRGKPQGGALLVAAVLSVIWAIVASYEATTGHPEGIFLAVTELLRDAGWLAFLFVVLFNQVSKSSFRYSLYGLAVISAVLVGIVGLLLAYVTFSDRHLPTGLAYDLRVFCHVAIGVVGLVLVEQLFRNASVSQRWSLKFLCLGVGGLFAFDFYLYADALLLNELDTNIWIARGFINVIVVPLIVVSAARNPDWSLDVFVSRQFVFHTTTLMGAGVYLIAMGIGGYYIRAYGGTWGTVAQVIFLFGAVVVLALLLFSGQMRAWIRVFLSKHFFNYRYDYREEWLRFTNALSVKGAEDQVRNSVISAVAETVESPGGLLWLQRGEDNYELVAVINIPVDESEVVANDNDSLVNFMREKHWVIDIDDYHDEPAIYEGLHLPNWLRELTQAWLVVPLLQQNKLFGFIVLARPRVKMSINWENRDLLKTTGRQAANYLALFDANQALVDAKQFDAFNRLSAYVVHDLKNITAQLSLVVKNAEKHKNNSEFIDDAFLTVDNAVKKMNRMLGQLRKERAGANSEKDLSRVNLFNVVEKVIAHRQIDYPKPELVSSKQDILVVADHDRLSAVIEHLVHNAQEATPDDGFVKVQLSTDECFAIIEIEDNGCGMDDQFIRNRLYRPFDTTKGNAGMGIGVYGKIEVRSTVDQGTAFKISLKLADLHSKDLQHSTSIAATK
jgi:putative PEP-CTERM system histidine kinase